MEFFLGLKNKEKVNGVWFYFFIPMVFGLIRPSFVLCNFSQNSLFSSRKFLAFYDFFGNLFSEKSHPMVSSWRDRWFIFVRSLFKTSPILASGMVDFSLLQIFLTCFLAFRLPQVLLVEVNLISAFCKFFFLNKAKTCVFWYFSFIGFFYLFLSLKNHP